LSRSRNPDLLSRHEAPPVLAPEVIFFGGYRNLGRNIYLRPIDLSFGPDATAAIASERAGALGGMGHIAFSHVEIIERDGVHTTRRVSRFEDCAYHDLIAAITAPRAEFGGVALAATRLMGIVNVTPDSFSDGGRLGSKQAAIAFGRQLHSEGADILDIGGESTRPGSDAVQLDDELERVIPVIAGLASLGSVSIDTRKSQVMRDAFEAGAVIVNDVSALTHDGNAVQTMRELQAPVVLMHAQGEPKTMQLNPRYDDVALDVYDFLRDRVAVLLDAGVARDKIMVDPGIGFGKSYRHNLDLLRQLTLFHGLGVPLLAGLSRKGIVGALTGEKVAANRIAGSVGGALQAALCGAHVLRVHDVKATKEALRTFWGAMDPDSTDV
jgi:dihydropteroate synthase